MCLRNRELPGAFARRHARTGRRGDRARDADEELAHLVVLPGLELDGHDAARRSPFRSSKPDAEDVAVLEAA